MRLCFFFACLLGFVSLQATSLKLKNDSPYPLRAIIRGADNSLLGEMVVQPNHSMTWTDVYGYGSSYSQGANAAEQQGARSKTPYTVTWQCLAGTDYSVCTNLTTGSLVFAQGCEGDRTCAPAKKAPAAAGETMPENSPSQ